GGAPGSGGAQGSGGAPSSGGAPGSGGAASGGAPGSGGAQGSGGSASGGASACADGIDKTAPGYVNLAPPMGAPLDAVGSPLPPPAGSPGPAGFTWYEIAGAKCRDGSAAGFFLRKGTVNKLLWYLEGGGACISPGFCNSFNPANVSSAISGT